MWPHAGHRAKAYATGIWAGARTLAVKLIITLTLTLTVILTRLSPRRLLLLDEPFGALDPQVRKSLRTGLKQIIDRVGITAIFVTHDQVPGPLIKPCTDLAGLWCAAPVGILRPAAS